MREPLFLAMDFGSGSGRGIAGQFDGDRLILRETARFQNYFVQIGNMLYWDTLHMYRFILEAMAETARQYGTNGDLFVGVDTWGTDYVLLDRAGQPIGGCRCSRNTKGAGRRAVEKLLGRRRLFGETGIQSIDGNTLYQLYERKMENDTAYENAASLLLLPDFFTYCLTGVRQAEYTEATTSMMLSPGKCGWNDGLLKELGLKSGILPEVKLPGRETFPIADCLTEGFGKWKLAVTAGHDTGCAVAAIPLEKDEIFCSSGTWSMIGEESGAPILTDEAAARNFANEGTPEGGIRFLKNCTGMWVIQQCAKQWEQMGEWRGWDVLVELARGKTPFLSLLDLEQPEFSSAGDMLGKIRAFCERTGQAVPETPGEVARCVYESMALGYRWAVSDLRAITGKTYRALRIAGGGSQNDLLNQFAANALQLPVCAGPVEAAAIGNILVQARAAGVVGNGAEMREIVKRSFAMRMFEPQDADAWDEAYERYREIRVHHAAH